MHGGRGSGTLPGADETRLARHSSLPTVPKASNSPPHTTIFFIACSLHRSQFFSPRPRPRHPRRPRTSIDPHGAYPMTSPRTIGAIPDEHIRDRLRLLSHLCCTASQKPKRLGKSLLLAWRALAFPSRKYKGHLHPNPLAQRYPHVVGSGDGAIVAHRTETHQRRWKSARH